MIAPINELFDLTAIGTINLSAAALAIPVFNRIYEPAKDKALALKQIEYIIFKHHWRSPYQVYSDPNLKEEKIKYHLFKDINYKIPEIVKQSEEEYANELQTNEVLQLLDSARKGIRYMTHAFNNLEQNQTNPNDVVKWTKELGAMAISLDTIERKVKAAELTAARTKGDREIKAFELPK